MVFQTIKRGGLSNIYIYIKNIIDLYNKLLVYDKNNINFIIDIDNIIWFILADITNILKYKSRKYDR